MRHYDGKAGSYELSVERGPLARLRRREREAVLRLAGLGEPAPEAPPGTLIDVGSGGGYFARAARAQGWSVAAIDFSAGMVKALRPWVDECWVADIETFRTDRRFERVICSGVLDFVADPERAFGNLARLVAPGGRLVIQAPRQGPGAWLYLLEKAFAGLRPRLYTLAWIEAQAARHGLELREAAFPLPHNLVVRLERKAAIRKEPRAA